MKTCSRCARTLPATAEHFSRRPNGLRAQCRTCYGTVCRQRIARDPERQRLAAHVCYVRNKAKYNATAMAWQSRNRDMVRARQRLQNRRTLSTPRGLLRNRIGPRLRAILRQRGNGFPIPIGAMRYLPYSVEELIAHLERKFLPEMGWHNVSEWEIDHIRPVSSFAYTSSDDIGFKDCWALDNLQPLWASDNRRKGATVAA